MKFCKFRDGMEGLGEWLCDWLFRRGDIEEVFRCILFFCFLNVVVKIKMKLKYIIIDDLYDELNCID